MFSRLGDVQVVYLFLMFCPKAFLFALLLGPSRFSKSIHHFLLHPNGSFLEIFGSSSLECPKAPLVCQQVALPISSEGVMLISSEIIALTAYLGSWPLIAPIITFRLLLNFQLILVVGDRCD